MIFNCFSIVCSYLQDLFECPKIERPQNLSQIGSYLPILLKIVERIIYKINIVQSFKDRMIQTRMKKLFSDLKSKIKDSDS